MNDKNIDIEEKYEDVIEYIKQLFSSANYKRCNDIRRKIYGK